MKYKKIVIFIASSVSIYLIGFLLFAYAMTAGAGLDPADKSKTFEISTVRLAMFLSHDLILLPEKGLNALGLLPSNINQGIISALIYGSFCTFIFWFLENRCCSKK